MHGERGAVGALQQALVFHDVALFGEDGGKTCPRICVKMIRHAGADDALERGFDHFGETLVAVENDSVLRGGDGAFLHLLDIDAIPLLGTRETVNLAAGGTIDDDSVHRAALDRIERLLRFPQTVAQIRKLLVTDPAPGRFAAFCAGLGGNMFGRWLGTFLSRGEKGARLHRAIHSEEAERRARLRPASTLSRSARFPIMRRAGLGAILISVGAAMICSFAAWVGCW